MYNERFMRAALAIARECAEHDEVPVGAVIVKDGEVIASGGNFKEREQNAICHAEIVALSKAAEAVGNWWLEGCEMYVTLEPCAMCAGAMVNARIDRLYFGAYDPKSGACGSKLNVLQEGLLNHDIEVTGGCLADECASILSDFFKNKRKVKRD